MGFITDLQNMLKKLNMQKIANPSQAPQEPLQTFQERQQYKTGVGYHIITSSNKEYLSVDQQGRSRKPE